MPERPGERRREEEEEEEGGDEGKEGAKEQGMWVTGELQASYFSGRQHKYQTSSFIIPAVQTHPWWLHWSCSESVDTTH